MIDNDNSIIKSLDSIHFNESHPIKLPSSRGKNIVIWHSYKYNLHRENKNSTIYICRHIVDKKQCSSTFKLNSDGTGLGKQDHSHESMTLIECDIMYINAEIDIRCASQARNFNSQ
jgi:hypothetical protein